MNKKTKTKPKPKPKSKSKSKHIKKGGWMFSSKNPISTTECDVNNLSSLSKDLGDGNDPETKMRENYKKCCPKKLFGRENTSPYCKQLTLNMKAELQNKELQKQPIDANDTTLQQDMAVTNSILQSEGNNEQIDYSNVEHLQKPQKKWYQFWGGKKLKRTAKTRRKIRKQKRTYKKSKTPKCIHHNCK